MNHQESDQGRLKAMIVDDEQHAIQQLRALLADEKRIEIAGGYTEPEEAVKRICETFPELLFLDIQMPGMNGFELLERLREAQVHPTVIFTTAYDRFAVEAIKTAAFDYLLKPIDKKLLKQSIDRFFVTRHKKSVAERYLDLLRAVNPNQKVRLSTAGGFIVLHMNDILYIKADWNYARVYLSDEQIEPITMNLGAVEKRLPMTRFMRINRSVIVNLNYLKRVRRLARECILEKDGREYTFTIPIVRIRQLEKML
jgi:two-component system LytT family response regulator